MQKHVTEHKSKKFRNKIAKVDDEIVVECIDSENQSAWGSHWFPLT